MRSLATRLLLGGALHPLRATGTSIGLRRLMDSPPPVATSHSLSLIGGLFYFTGGVVAVGAAVAMPDTGRRSELIMLIGGVAMLVGLALARFASFISLPARRAVNFVGTGFVLAVVLLAGPDAGGPALYWLFCYVPLDAFLFFPWRWALPMFGWLLGATAIASFGAHVISPAEWCVVVVVTSVAAFAIGWLVQFAADGVWDPGTDMLNRRGFERDLSSRCSAASHTGRGFALATISLSGPDRGVAAELRARSELTMGRLATLWRSDSPPAATWARIGDAEFAVLWDGTRGFDDYLEQVRDQAVSTHPVSIGASDFQRGNTPVQMLSEATSGSIFSELHGGNRVTRAGLVSDHVDELRTAIELGQVVPFYQPVVDLGSGHVVGAEALARWLHPGRGVVGPEVFIPLAEQSGLIHALGRAILRRACMDAATWQPGDADGGGASIRLAVNVSGLQLRDDAFVDLVARCLCESGLPASGLTLEVTETTVAADDPEARHTLERLREAGVSIAMDDFGTGYSNLARLANLPIDVLKIDRSFVLGLDDPGHAKALLRAILALAAGIGLRTVVEGIELAEHANFVTSCGAHQGQGWLYGPAVAADDFPAVIVRAATRARREPAPAARPLVADFGHN